MERPSATLRMAEKAEWVAWIGRATLGGETRTPTRLDARSVSAPSYAIHPQTPGVLDSLKRKAPRLAGLFDGPGRDRTCDLGIKSPLLYQLSYRP
jgi:hypothetical protein